MQYIHNIVDILNWIAIHIPLDGVFATGLLTAIFIGPATLIKKWFKHYEKIIVTVIGVTGVTITFVWSYVLHTYGTDPNVVALQGLALAFGTQPFYQIIIKPLSKRIALWFAKQVASAKTLTTDPNAELKTAIEPAGDLNNPPTDDFTN